MAGDIFYEKQEDIASGLNNAINRGETLDIARSTFLNAGYDPQIVNGAANQLLAEGGGRPVLLVAEKSGELPLHAKKDGAVPHVNSMKKKHRAVMGIPYWVVVLMVLITLGIVVGAAVLGLYWNKIF